MKNCLSLHGEDVSVEIHDNELIYTYHRMESRKGFIPFAKILRSELCSEKSCGKLDIHFVIKKRDNCLKHQKLTFTGPLEDCTQINDKICQHLAETHRPQRLLVFINPNSGKKKARSVYHKHTERLFRLCNVNAEVIVTSKAQQATRILMEYDFKLTDGIVAVGGDGFYNEVVSGLIKRQQKDNGLDYNDPDVPVIPWSVPVGIIPAGSGNYIVQYLHGTKCPETAVLKILLGSFVQSNIASVHEGQHLSGYSGLILGFGLFGDMMKDCEKYRWLPKRYQVIPLTSLMKRRTVDVKVSYVPSEEGESVKKSRNPKYERQISLPAKRNMALGLSRTMGTSTPDLLKDLEEWKRTEGRVYALDTHPITMAAKEETMVPKFGEDALTLYMTEKCSLMKHIDQLTKVRDEKSDCYQYDFIKALRVQRYRVHLQNVDLTSEKTLEHGYYINLDGEAVRLNKPEFEVNGQRNVKTPLQYERFREFGICNVMDAIQRRSAHPSTRLDLGVIGNHDNSCSTKNLMSLYLLNFVLFSSHWYFELSTK